MSEDETAGSSLLLTQHHSAHREHSKQRHHHLHGSLRKKNVELGEVVTEIVATISIIQQISIDPNGNTIGIETIQTHLSNKDISAILTKAPPAATQPAQPAPTDAPSDTEPVQPTEPVDPVEELPVPPVDTTTEILPPEPSPSPDSPLPESTSAPLPSITLDAQISSTVAGTYSASPGFDAASVPTSIPSITETNTFPSLIASLNSTNLIANSSSLTQTYTNSTRSSSKLSTSKSSRSTQLLSSTGSSYSSYTASTYLTAPSDGGFVAAGSGVAPGNNPESTSGSSSSSNNNSDDSTPTPVVIGGVVGSIAGAAVLIVALLFLLRWRKRGRGMLLLGDGTRDEAAQQSRSLPPPTQPSTAMTERRNTVFAIPAAFSKRFSQKQEDPAPAPTTEKGFYRVSGRKLPSVLQTGGDGYGGDFHNDDFRDSHAFFGSMGPPPLPLGGPMPSNRESMGGVPIFRPSPARTPTREESPFSFSHSEVTPPPIRPDGLGRSHASQDGSHPSRFTEEV